MCPHLHLGRQGHKRHKFLEVSLLARSVDQGDPRDRFQELPSLYDTFLFTLLTLNGLSSVCSLLNCLSQFPLK